MVGINQFIVFNPFLYFRRIKYLSEWEPSCSIYQNAYCGGKETNQTRKCLTWEKRNDFTFEVQNQSKNFSNIFSAHFEIFQLEIITHNFCIDCVFELTNNSGHCKGFPSEENNFHSGNGPFWLRVKISARSWLVIGLQPEDVIGAYFLYSFI